MYKVFSICSFPSKLIAGSSALYLIRNEYFILLLHGLTKWVFGDAKWIYQFQAKPKQGDTVTVTASKKTGTIKWSIDGKEIGSHSFNRLKNKDIEWVPYVQMYGKGDKVLWME